MTLSNSVAMKRAYRAYFRAGRRDQPNSSLSRVTRSHGHRVVTLRNVHGVLARYKIGKKNLRKL